MGSEGVGMASLGRGQLVGEVSGGGGGMEAGIRLVP